MPRPVLTLQLPPAAVAPAVARRAAAPWLRETGVPDAAAANALLVISELVTDGVLHSGGDIDIRAEVEGGALFIHVTTPPSVLDAPREGVALGLVGACCDVVDIRDDVSGFRHVVCTIALR